MSKMRPDKRTRQAALLADPQALALWAERKRAREVQAIVKSNQGSKSERLNWRRDKSFDRDYVLGKCYHAPREMRSAMGSTSKGGGSGRFTGQTRGANAGLLMTPSDWPMTPERWAKLSPARKVEVLVDALLAFAM